MGAVGHRLGDGPDEVTPFEDRLLGGEPLGADQPLRQAAGRILGDDDGPGSPYGGDVSVRVDAHREGLAAPEGTKVDRIPDGVVARLGRSRGWV